MANNKKNDAITAMEDDFAQWYTDVCRKAELMDYSSVKGFIIYRPYSYAMWEQSNNTWINVLKKQDMRMFICRCLFHNHYYKKNLITLKDLHQNAQ